MSKKLIPIEVVLRILKGILRQQLVNLELAQTTNSLKG